MLALLILTLDQSAAGRWFHEALPQWSYEFRVGRDRWTLRWACGQAEWLADERAFGFYGLTDQRMRIEKNGKVVFTRDHEGGLTSIKRAWFPTPFPVIWAKAHSSCGHGEEHWFLAIKRGQLELLHYDSTGEIGGPVFRDFDNDGVMEWVFDDYSWYGDYGSPPKNLLIYKLWKTGPLKLWRKIPNVHGVHVDRSHAPSESGMELADLNVHLRVHPLYRGP